MTANILALLIYKSVRKIMTKPAFQRQFQQKIAGAILNADSVGNLDHREIEGRAREIFASEMLKLVLPPEISLGTGKVVDRLGNLSKQIDILLYSKSIMPPFLWSEASGEGIFPVESCLYSIEVKSTLTKEGIGSACQNSASFSTLRVSETGFWQGRNYTELPATGLVFGLFGFASDIKGSIEDEIKRYVSVDPSGLTNPSMKFLCIRGKGYAYFSKENTWKYVHADAEHIEVMMFLAGTANTLPELLAVKGRPKFGGYLVTEERFSTLENGAT